MADFYQNLPQVIDPIAFSIGFFSVHWYSVAYLAGFTTVYGLLRYRILKGEGEYLISNFQFQISKLLSDWMIYSMAGLLIGARLGHVLFYNFQYYFQNPLAVFSPYDLSLGKWIGISGMSYFGGALGVILASWLFIRRRKINFWAWSDWVIPAIPAGYFFGRIGNWLNGELYGTLTEKPWGMYFPGSLEKGLRHPTQLYEAFGEGVVIFAILWFVRNKTKFPGALVSLYLFGYGFFRLGIEFFRQSAPGERLFLGVFTLSQLFALAFMAFGMILWATLSKRKETV